MNVPVIHIQLDENGIPRTINGQVKVTMIAQKHLIAGESFESIAEFYAIGVADVYAALAYYYDNQKSFEQRSQELEPLNDDAQRYSTDLKAKIQQRLHPKTS